MATSLAQDIRAQGEIVTKMKKEKLPKEEVIAVMGKAKP